MTIESEWNRKIKELSQDTEVLDLVKRIQGLAEDLDVNLPILLECLEQLVKQVEADN